MNNCNKGSEDVIYPFNKGIKSWIDEIQDTCQYQELIIYDSKLEEKLIVEMVEEKILLPLNDKLRPNSYLARSSTDDVARLESRTFICTSEDNPNKANNWRSTASMKSELMPLYQGCMKEKTAYLVPFVMGALDDTGVCGLMITDSSYVAISTGVMARTGYEVLDYINTGKNFIKCLHSVGTDGVSDIGGLKWKSSTTKWICHFPEEETIYSYGSGYGGNAILSKKCLALRIASYKGYQEGWYAEHMMLISLTNKTEGKTIYIAGAFPSACGKTNMAMLKSKLPEWEVKTIGDDITWLRIFDGQLYGMNPETGFFGVAPNTSPKTNPVCMETISKNTIFTNVGLTPDGDVWWEGCSTDKIKGLINWKGLEDNGTEPVAHPNSRFTVRANQCPQWSFEDDKKWVPISAIIFGGKRENNGMPLIREAISFEQGVLMGGTLSSEMTAASDGVIGTIRYDPFAMLPFIGYDIGAYFDHWLAMKDKLSIIPHMYYINLFGKENGKFVWPGFSENIHILAWIYNRVVNNTDCIITPIGNLPLNHKELNYTFWKQQLQLDYKYLVDNNSPVSLIELINTTRQKLDESHQ